MCVAKAKATYSVTQKALQDGAHALCEKVAKGDFIPGAMKHLAMVDQAKFHDFADKCYDTKRNEALKLVCLGALVPELAVLEANKTKIENSITALKDSFDLGWTDCLFAETQFKTDIIYDVLRDLDERDPMADEEDEDMEI
jgi:hypothetical protein